MQRSSPAAISSPWSGAPDRRPTASASLVMYGCRAATVSHVQAGSQIHSKQQRHAGTQARLDSNAT
jgi:hypothetical protein